jgi:hypothetical protein
MQKANLAIRLGITALIVVNAACSPTLTPSSPTRPPTWTPTPGESRAGTATATSVPTAPPTWTREANALHAVDCLPPADWLQARLDIDPSGDLRAALGCPVDQPRAVFLAFQLYRRGRMVWREDTRQIYVLLTDGRWSVFDDTWDETEPESGYYPPPPNLVEPKRGFGKVWRDQLGGPDAAISWAVAEEIGVEGAWQSLQNGDAISLGQYGVLIVLADGTWK